MTLQPLMSAIPPRTSIGCAEAERPLTSSIAHASAGSTPSAATVAGVSGDGSNIARTCSCTGMSMVCNRKLKRGCHSQPCRFALRC